MPFYYYLTDLLTEVYGYKYARQATWMMFFCCIIFSSIITLIIKSPPSAYSGDYNFAFGHLFRTTFGGTFVTILTSTFVNSYIISKWKILIRGKYFWLRSLGASGIGEAVEVFLECLILYAGFIPQQNIMSMILPTYIAHIIIRLFHHCSRSHTCKISKDH